MPERGKLRKLFDSTKLMCDAFLQSFLILVSSPLVSSPYPLQYTNTILHENVGALKCWRPWQNVSYSKCRLLKMSATQNVGAQEIF
jgi:hypothetical protein